MSTSMVQCPYCHEVVELEVDDDTEGTYVEDCEVCCNPWQISVQRSGDEEPTVTVVRAQ